MEDEANDGRTGARTGAADRSDSSLDRGPAYALDAEWFAAAGAADPSALGALIRIDYGIVNARDELGRTALHVVAALPAGGVEAAKVLVSAGVPVDGTDGAAHTALWHAITAPNREMALLLLEVGAATDGCLHPAIASGDQELIGELIDCGADLEETAGGESALDHARRLGLEQAARLIEEELQRRS